MYFQLVEKSKRPLTCLWNGLWLAALMGTLLSLMGSMEYFWAALPGVALVIGASFLSRRQQGVVGLAIFSLCAVWFLLRYMPILNGLGFLANRLFALSEESQGYYYIYFTVVGEAPAESLLFVSAIIGAFCIWMGGGINLVLSLLVAVMIAYFGVVPSIVWVCALIISAFANALPKQSRWIPAILIAIFVSATAFSIQTVAPEPNLQISTVVEKLWDLLVPVDSPEEVPPPPTQPPTTAPTTAPTLPEEEDFEEEDFEVLESTEAEEPTETEPTDPPPEEEVDVPMNGQRAIILWLKMLLRKLGWPLLALCVLALWHMLLTKKRRRNRASMYVKDNAAAIRGMFLYAKRWRKLHPSPEAIPQEVEDIWLEAAYSAHEMADAQREIMHAFVRDSARATWRALKWWKRFVVYYYRGL